ncbi:hypothetical protein MADA3029_1150056 [Vibrio nigripulchritudo MADA3029]|nr:hypothetical protein VIBNIMADA3020_630057 [Vibrio nigripulchritudo MADA3020]CCN51488.1 hypothetical protein VIBNIMADA3021_1080058 [Vibrio nigripulchritudo MADA3021]CCN57670.1 hypothetical protein MADA3029_1150056 [Vibrio nigripulchritudo MADA3029]
MADERRGRTALDFSGDMELPRLAETQNAVTPDKAVTFDKLTG